MEKKSFPANKREALTLLYLQNQDLSGKTAEELVVMYKDAYEKISIKFSER